MSTLCAVRLCDTMNLYPHSEIQCQSGFCSCRSCFPLRAFFHCGLLRRVWRLTCAQKAERFGFSQCEFRTGDLNALDFPDGTFSACLSQFALHHTNLERSLVELARVLAPGGTLVIQDWAGETSPLHQAVYDVLVRYRVAEPGEWVAGMRENSSRARAFRLEFGSHEAMQTAVAAHGLNAVEAFDEYYPARVATADAFIEVATVSPIMQAELSAMSHDRRLHFLDEAHLALVELQTGGAFEWRYHVVSVVGRK